ncbi:MAG: DUF4097 domain-containing protein [Lactobacillales bacterium]|jgi:hypothetical protein|nr:DUF4097 domain-containing protein [Lactobacillales bacterium]
MKKSMIIGVGLIVFGGIMACIGISMKHDYSGVFWENGKGFVVMKDFHEVQTIPEFNKISADMTDYELEVRAGDKFELELQGWKSTKKPTFEVKNNELRVKMNGKFDKIGIGNFSNHDEKVLVIVPKEFAIDEINVKSSGYSDMKLDRVHVKNLKITGSHNLYTGGAKIDNLVMDTKDGNIVWENSQVLASSIKATGEGSVTSISSVLTNQELWFATGEFDAEDTIFVGKNMLSVNHGEVDLRNAGYDGLDIKVEDGNISVGNKDSELAYEESGTGKDLLVIRGKDTDVDIQK